jgi:hypothetical protein
MVQNSVDSETVVHGKITFRKVYFKMMASVKVTFNGKMLAHVKMIV